MTFTAASRNALLTALALGAALLSPETRADSKYFAASAVCAPFTASAPDFAKLRFRPEGIINDSDTSKFVICNLPRDSETAWSTDTIFMAVAFRRIAATGAPAVASNQCTLTVGFNGSEPLQSQTYFAKQETQTYGVLTIDGNDMPTSDANSYAVIVCRIVSGSLMDIIVVRESAPTD